MENKFRTGHNFGLKLDGKYLVRINFLHLNRFMNYCSYEGNIVFCVKIQSEEMWNIKQTMKLTSGIIHGTIRC